MANIKPLRVRAKETYIYQVETGTFVNLPTFSRQSRELLGEPVPLNTLRSWYKEEGWDKLAISSSFDASEELKRTREMLDIARDGVILAGEDEHAKGVASAAAAYRALVRKLPDTLSYAIRDEIEHFREELYERIKTYKAQGANMAHLATMMNVWKDMQKFLLTEVPGQEKPTRTADEMILAQR